MAGFDASFKDPYHVGHAVALLLALLLPTLPASLTLIGHFLG